MRMSSSRTAKPSTTCAIDSARQARRQERQQAPRLEQPRPQVHDGEDDPSNDYEAASIGIADPCTMIIITVTCYTPALPV